MSQPLYPPGAVAGSFDVRRSRNQTIPEESASFFTDSQLLERADIVLREIPEWEDDPAAVNALIHFADNNAELHERVRSLRNYTTTNKLMATLDGLDDNDAIADWYWELDDNDQTLMRNVGFVEPPKPERNDGPWWDLVSWGDLWDWIRNSMSYTHIDPAADAEAEWNKERGDVPVLDEIGGALDWAAEAFGEYVGGPAIEGLTWVSDRPAHLWRMGRALEEADVDQIGGFRFGDFTLPFTGKGRKILADAWSDTYDGDKYFHPERERELLEGLDDLTDGDRNTITTYSYAAAQGDNPREALAEDWGLDPDSAEFTERFTTFIADVGEARLQEFIGDLETSKVTFGRSVASTIPGVDEGSDVFNYISGAFDAAFVWFLDPFLLGGKAMKGYKLARYGLNASNMGADISRVQALERVRLVERYGEDAVAAGLTTRQLARAGASRWALNQRIADAFVEGRAGDTKAFSRLIKEHHHLVGALRPLLRYDIDSRFVAGLPGRLGGYERGLSQMIMDQRGIRAATGGGINRAEDVFDFYRSQGGITALASGRFYTATKYATEIPHMSRRGAYFSRAKGRALGAIDTAADGLKLPEGASMSLDDMTEASRARVMATENVGPPAPGHTRVFRVGFIDGDPRTRSTAGTVFDPDEDVILALGAPPEGVPSLREAWWTTNLDEAQQAGWHLGPAARVYYIDVPDETIKVAREWAEAKGVQNAFGNRWVPGSVYLADDIGSQYKRLDGQVADFAQNAATGEVGHWSRFSLSPRVIGARIFKTLTTRLPEGTTVGFEKPEAVADIFRFLEWGLPTEVRDFYFHNILTAPNYGVARQTFRAAMDKMFELGGVYHTEAGRDLAERFLALNDQFYAPYRMDMFNVGGKIEPVGILPRAHWAGEIAIPNYREWLAGTQKMSLTRAIFGGINHPYIDAAMGKYWKPAVLLRPAFIPRAAGEEVFNTILRFPEQFWRSSVFGPIAMRYDRRWAKWFKAAGLDDKAAAMNYHRLHIASSSMYDVIPRYAGQFRKWGRGEDFLDWWVKRYADTHPNFQWWLGSKRLMLRHPVIQGEFSKVLGGSSTWGPPETVGELQKISERWIPVQQGDDVVMVKMKTVGSTFEEIARDNPEFYLRFTGKLKNAQWDELGRMQAQVHAIHVTPEQNNVFATLMDEGRPGEVPAFAGRPSPIHSYRELLVGDEYSDVREILIRHVDGIGAGQWDRAKELMKRKRRFVEAKAARLNDELVRANEAVEQGGVEGARQAELNALARVMEVDEEIEILNKVDWLLDRFDQLPAGFRQAVLVNPWDLLRRVDGSAAYVINDLVADPLVVWHGSSLGTPKLGTFEDAIGAGMGGGAAAGPGLYVTTKGHYAYNYTAAYGLDVRRARISQMRWNRATPPKLINLGHPSDDVAEAYFGTMAAWDEELDVMRAAVGLPPRPEGNWVFDPVTERWRAGREVTNASDEATFTEYLHHRIDDEGLDFTHFHDQLYYDSISMEILHQLAAEGDLERVREILAAGQIRRVRRLYDDVAHGAANRPVRDTPFKEALRRYNRDVLDRFRARGYDGAWDYAANRHPRDPHAFVLWDASNLDMIEDIPVDRLEALAEAQVPYEMATHDRIEALSRGLPTSVRPEDDLRELSETMASRVLADPELTNYVSGNPRSSMVNGQTVEAPLGHDFARLYTVMVSPDAVNAAQYRASQLLNSPESRMPRTVMAGQADIGTDINAVQPRFQTYRTEQIEGGTSAINDPRMVPAFDWGTTDRRQAERFLDALRGNGDFASAPFVLGYVDVPKGTLPRRRMTSVRPGSFESPGTGGVEALKMQNLGTDKRLTDFAIEAIDERPIPGVAGESPRNFFGLDNTQFHLDPMEDFSRLRPVGRDEALRPTLDLPDEEVTKLQRLYDALVDRTNLTQISGMGPLRAPRNQVELLAVSLDNFVQELVPIYGGEAVTWRPVVRLREAMRSGNRDELLAAIDELRDPSTLLALDPELVMSFGGVEAMRASNPWIRKERMLDLFEDLDEATIAKMTPYTMVNVDDPLYEWGQRSLERLGVANDPRFANTIGRPRSLSSEELEDYALGFTDPQAVIDDAEILAENAARRMTLAEYVAHVRNDLMPLAAQRPPVLKAILGELDELNLSPAITDAITGQGVFRYGSARYTPSPTHADAMKDWSELSGRYGAAHLISPQTGRSLHEIAGPMSRGRLRLTDVEQVPFDDLPLATVGPKYLLFDPNLREKIIRFGFDRVLGPAIGAIARKPLFHNNFSVGLREAQALRPFFERPELTAVAEGVLVSQRIDDIDELRYMLDSMGDVFERGKPLSSAGLRAVAPEELKNLTDQTWLSLAAWRRNDEALEQAMFDTALNRAFNDSIPFIDDSRIRSQFSEYIRNMSPFYFAEEQFLKRWARSIIQDPAVIQKARLILMGAKHSGIVTQNENGEDIYVIPGSQYVNSFLADVVGRLTGKEMTLPVAVPITGQIKYATPGFDRLGVPGASPVVGLPMSMLAARFPELAPINRAVLGERGTGKSVFEMIMPTSVTRIYRAATADPDSDAQFMSAMVQAAQYLEANGLTPGPDATAEEHMEFIERAKNWARVIMVTRSIFGLVAPASPELMVPGTLDTEFRELLKDGIPLNEAIDILVARNPDATPFTVFSTTSEAGATPSLTDETFQIMTDNRDFFSAYRAAGPWLLPQSEADDEFSRLAYYESLALGLKTRKDFREWYYDMRFSADARAYFASRDAFEATKAELAQMPSGATRSARNQALEIIWSEWRDSYLQMHPLFAEMLAQPEGHQRRMRVISQLEQALVDDRRPDVPHAANLRQVIVSWRSYQEAFDSLRLERGRDAGERRKALENLFFTWVSDYADEHPAIRSFVDRILEPERRYREVTVPSQEVA